MSDTKEAQLTETIPPIEDMDVTETEETGTIAQVDVTGNEVDQP